MSFMSVTERVFIDTNVAVYLLAEDAAKAARAEALFAARPTISTQVVNEFVSVCIRKLKLDRDAAYASARALMRHCEVVPVTVATIDEAMRLGSRFGLSHWDTLVIAAAVQSDCAVLYSEDMQDGQRFGAVTVRNPFR
jgi:predicted nucleic acid-binding protein